MKKSTLDFLQNMINSISLISFDEIDSYREYKNQVQFSIIEVDLKTFSSFEENDFDISHPFQVYVPFEQKELLTKPLLKIIKTKKILVRLDDTLNFNNFYLKHNSYYISDNQKKNSITIQQNLKKSNLYKCSIYGIKIHGNYLSSLCLSKHECKINFKVHPKHFTSFLRDLHYYYFNEKNNECKNDFFIRSVKETDSNYIEVV